MSFLKILLIFIISGFIVCLVFGPASLSAYGVIFVLVLQVISEVCQCSTTKGRKQIQKEIKEQKKIEENFGIIDIKDKDD